MTYNFDPDKWYDNEFFIIQTKLKTGEITPIEFDKESEILDKKHEELWKRLDGTYQISPDNEKKRNNFKNQCQVNPKLLKSDN
ncbi:MAG: hypothetical protein HOG03_06265 [Desulfobacula sp.]|uniref:hypothetical protein n=1 Tax=Desulfobacula sp. TaxID=2593537 RepID=UPI001DD18B7B|nr:hypothetical protein [Desulfobacula sp.]MBT3484994.1 hypothetical protein [Desulfobacula sp.]MBT3804189.1 hypothetical protein [Desulfobacula sp.]MBT4025045.1 hypothetical protein [Desulfobacula sp.]MBT4198645.1 hypothetical protein [Desulfobacula sp.]